MKIVFLPGLDGTGELFALLLEHLDSTLEVEIISYDTQKTQSYNELIEYVLTKLPADDFILLAESFSGYIGYKIALKNLPNLKHLIVVATFLKNPRPILLNFIPSKYIFLLPLPKFIIKKFFLGSRVSKKTLNLFQRTIKALPPKILDFRLQQIKKLQLPQESISIPTSYIQVKNDKLVLKNSLKDWEKVSLNLEVYQVEGNHLILQSHPKECAKIINSIVKKV